MELVSLNKVGKEFRYSTTLIHDRPSYIESIQFDSIIFEFDKNISLAELNDDTNDIKLEIQVGYNIINSYYLTTLIKFIEPHIVDNKVSLDLPRYFLLNKFYISMLNLDTVNFVVKTNNKTLKNVNLNISRSYITNSVIDPRQINQELIQFEMYDSKPKYNIIRSFHELQYEFCKYMRGLFIESEFIDNLDRIEIKWGSLKILRKDHINLSYIKVSDNLIYIPFNKNDTNFKELPQQKNLLNIYNGDYPDVCVIFDEPSIIANFYLLTIKKYKYSNNGYSNLGIFTTDQDQDTDTDTDQDQCQDPE